MGKGLNWMSKWWLITKVKSHNRRLRRSHRYPRCVSNKGSLKGHSTSSDLNLILGRWSYTFGPDVLVLVLTWQESLYTHILNLLFHPFRRVFHLVGAPFFSSSSPTPIHVNRVPWQPQITSYRPREPLSVGLSGRRQRRVTLYGYRIEWTQTVMVPKNGS